MKAARNIHESAGGRTFVPAAGETPSSDGRPTALANLTRLSADATYGEPAGDARGGG